MGHKLQPQPLTAGKTGHERQWLVYVLPREKEARRRGHGGGYRGARAEGKTLWWISIHPESSAHRGQQALKGKRGGRLLAAFQIALKFRLFWSF